MSAQDEHPALGIARSVADGLLSALREYELLVPGAEVICDFEITPDGQLAVKVRSTKPVGHQGHGPKVVK